MKEIKNYLNLYLGCRCTIIANDGIPYTEETLTAGLLNEVIHGRFKTAKPILRPLSSMTEEERDWLDEHEEFVNHYIESGEPQLIIEWNAEKITYLLSKHFDLFGLIEAGLAIDATSQNILK